MDSFGYINDLKEIIEQNIDASQSYNLVSREEKNKILARTFNNQANRHKNFAYKLAEIAHVYDQSTIKNIRNGSIVDHYNNNWHDLEKALLTGTDQALINECIRLERLALTKYEELSSGYLPFDVQDEIDDQQNSIRDYIINLEKIAYELEQNSRI
ncbi:DUF2383 domain-containing protein [Mangrovivirga cuniculi]|uniref:DUF2383 domain-containing protein n=1 Tax=Mangrovivirga cuniculi TaxID=2715131 RepID=A0A4D7JR49_9BACT|nr:DUF2383 domain-containing protein [Mangrovivirga cuniculi]QCK15232.1 hypothetical protein DCC35_10980 [Mangrovivirga cuniculi]